MKSLPLYVSIVGLLVASHFTASAQSVPAESAVTVNALGPVSGANGDKYLNVEGKSKDKYACFGVLRFKTTVLKAELDKKFGVGKYKVTGVKLELSQSNAKFSAAGNVKVYFSADAKTATTGLKYPYNPTGKTLAGSQVGQVTFTPVPNPAPATPAGAKTDKPAPRPESHRDVVDISKGAGSGALSTAISSGAVVTLVLAEGDAAVAATWSGTAPVGKNKPPAIVVTAVKK
ncbi:MAG: hypothetical protein ABJA67_15830 [Chthonomonadales bacterium]